MKHALTIGLAAGLFAAGLVLGRSGFLTAPAMDARSPSSASNPARDAPEERRVLYWYDPMKPGQHFEKPGKSPFMDMDLQPKYADSEAAPSGGVRIDPTFRQNTGVRTSEVVTGPLPMSMPVPGVVQWNARHVAVVQTRAAGFVTRVFGLAPGDLIAEGAPLAELHVSMWAAPQSEYLALRALPDAALAAAARARLATIGVPDAVVRQAEMQGKPATTIQIRTPIAGVITALDVREGMNLDTGGTLATVNGIDSVWIQASWPLARSAEVKVDARAEVAISAYPGEWLSGRVDAVLPDADADSRSLKVRIELPNPDQRLRLGMYAEVRLAAGDDTPVLSVPDSAVIRGASGNYVFVARDDGLFSPVAVVLGRSAGDRVEVRSGLVPGQRIVASGQFLLDSEANLAGTLPQFGKATGPDKTPALPAHGTHDGAAAEMQASPHD